MIPSVTYGPPPSTGSQKCVSCQGWITSRTQYWVDGSGPICPNCNSRVVVLCGGNRCCPTVEPSGDLYLVKDDYGNHLFMSKHGLKLLARHGTEAASPDTVVEFGPLKMLASQAAEATKEIQDHEIK